MASGKRKSSAKSSAAAGSDIGSAGSVTKGASDARGPLPLTNGETCRLGTPSRWPQGDPRLTLALEGCSFLWRKNTWIGRRADHRDRWL